MEAGCSAEDGQLLTPTDTKDGEVPMHSEEHVEARLVEAIARDAAQLGITEAPAGPEAISPAVQALMDRREAVGGLRKAIEGLVLPVESSIKARCKLAKAQEATREAAQAGFDVVIKRIDDAMSGALLLAIQIDESANGDKWQQVVAEVSKEAKAELRTKKQLVAFSDFARKQGQECVKLHKTLLSEIKALKANERGEHTNVTEGVVSEIGL